MTDNPDVRGRIDRLLADFRRYVHDNARRERAFLPAYSLWLDRVASAVRTNTARPTRHENIVAQAEAEIEPFRYARPPFRDLDTWAAIVEETRLDSLGAKLVTLVRDEPETVRTDAAAYLLDRYALDWRSAVEN